MTMLYRRRSRRMFSNKNVVLIRKGCIRESLGYFKKVLDGVLKLLNATKGVIMSNM